MDRGHSRGIAAEAAPALNHIAADRSFLHIAVIPLLLAVVVYFILDWTLEVGCEQPRIRGLTQVPGWPVVGSLFFRMQGSQAITFRHWAKMYGTVYQVRLGSKRVVVVNSFDIARELWVDNMRATASRPTSYTFHSILCATQGPTIGTTPWSEEYRTRRRISGKALNQPSVNKYISMIDNECISVVRALAHETSYEEKCEVAPRRFFDTYSININLQLSYGTKVEYVNRQLIQEVLQVEKEICKIRSSDSLYQDYLPFLRLIPSFWWKAKIENARQRRDKYMAFFLDNLLEEIDKGISRPCILRRLLDGSEKQPISQVDIKSICLTMVSAGLDTIPAVLCAFVGHMSLPHGRECQERAYQELCDVFPDGTAWDRLVEEPQFRYLRALVKETLRVSTMPISLPRQTVKEITLRNGVVIPPKTVLLLNSYAANFDPNHYSNPDAFDPTRYLNSQGDHDLPHFSFGAGMRMCAGAHLVNRELLIAFSRLILAFRVLPPVHDRHLFVSDPQEIYKRPSVMVMPVPEFRVRLVPRDRSLLRQWLTRD